ncbi:MAG: hypothetical protein CM15mP87_01510 [Candidatus Neomarinimicrobiota bacterium]|nr:MAG: hypothetical protein CM15mP87_01510 [Candidatus Neomarinimicrobiota bacterium]
MTLWRETMSYTLEVFPPPIAENRSGRPRPGRTKRKFWILSVKLYWTKNSSPPTSRLPCPKIATSFIGMKNSVSDLRAQQPGAPRKATRTTMARPGQFTAKPWRDRNDSLGKSSRKATGPQTATKVNWRKATT